MKIQAEINSISVIGRQWFQQSFGNTYFTANILINGEKVGELPFQYGYGDHYIDMAADWLEKHGFIDRDHSDNGSSTPLWFYRDEFGIAVHTSSTDVQRKKDL